MATKTAVLITAILVLTGGFHQAKREKDQSDWIIFSPKNGGFSVKLPGKPMERSLPAREPGEMPSPLYEVASEGLSYVITYRDYPIPEGAPTDGLLEKAANAGITAAGAKVTSNKPISKDGYPGREVKGEREDLLYQSRLFFVKQRLYFLIVWLPADKNGSEDVAKFFESFQTWKE